MTSLFKSEDGRSSILQWYQRFLDRVESPTESRTLTTSFGETHVLVAGPEDAPPVVVLHGALASSAHVLVEIQPLLEDFRVYAVDVIGQSVKSAPQRLSVTNNDHGLWLAEVMDQLSLSRAHILGVSWGGFVAIRLAATAPERIEKLVLLVPAGVVKTPFINNFKVGFPMTAFMLAPTPRRQERFLATQLTTMDDEYWSAYLGNAFQSYKLNMKIPALANPEEFTGLTAPVFVVAADQDLSFPGEKLLSRAQKLFATLEKTELIENSLHCPPTTDEFRHWLCHQIKDFLTHSQSPERSGR